jgi:hypothetical protein
MRLNAGMANRWGRRLALRTSLRPHLALWLGLEVFLHSADCFYFVKCTAGSEDNNTTIKERNESGMFSHFCVDRIDGLLKL